MAVDTSADSAGFQSTHPKRDETAGLSCHKQKNSHFNPLIPNGMRPVPYKYETRVPNIFQSTHPKRDETVTEAGDTGDGKFQSTHPKRDETDVAVCFGQLDIVFQSTHPKRDETQAQAA